ncbi:hypothetical protein CSB11_01530 [Candidatus Campbellbacteria bacterium]|nr:MAG: hypothetical protein CSB11_01530 [Candidatus Campbellbacteria bacterium]
MEKDIIININTSAVVASVVSYGKKNAKPKIEYTEVNYIDFKKDIDFDLLKQNTQKSLEFVLEKIYNFLHLTGNLNTVNRGYVFLSSPWIKKKFYQIKDENLKPFLANSEYLEKFIGDNGTVSQDSEIVSAEILSVKANGYNLSLTDIVDKKINKIEASILDTQIKTEDKNFIEEIILNKFNTLKITFSAFLPVFLNQIQNIVGDKKDFAFLDFTGEMMEYGIYKNHEIKDVVIVQEGRNEIIRSLVSEKISENNIEAEKTFILFLKEQLKDEKKKQVQEVIDKHIERIKKEIQKQTEKYDFLELPQKTFVLSYGLMNLILENYTFLNQIIFINKSYIKQFVNFENDNHYNIFTAVEADYIYQTQKTN